MSVVTDVIVLVSLAEEDPEDTFPPIDKINNWLLAHGQYVGLNHLNGNEGGHKAWQADVFGGAFNHLDISEFARMVAMVQWKSPDRVQLLVKGEEDEVWGLVNIVAPYQSRQSSAAAVAARKALGRERPDAPWE
jgi:hypothetical protein